MNLYISTENFEFPTHLHHMLNPFSRHPLDLLVCAIAQWVVADWPTYRTNDAARCPTRCTLAPPSRLAPMSRCDRSPPPLLLDSLSVVFGTDLLLGENVQAILVIDCVLFFLTVVVLITFTILIYLHQKRQNNKKQICEMQHTNLPNVASPKLLIGMYIL